MLSILLPGINIVDLFLVIGEANNHDTFYYEQVSVS